MKNLTKHISLILVFALFVAIPWIEVGGAHLFLFDCFHERFEILFYAKEINRYQLVASLVALMIVIALFLALSLSRFFCGKFCPNTLFSIIYEFTLHKRKRSVIQNVLFCIFVLIFAFVFSFSFLSFFAPSLELSRLILSGENSISVWFFYGIGILFFLEVVLIRGWYCAYLCPYGAICTILPHENRRSFEFSCSNAQCKECNKCVEVCPVPDLDIRVGFDARCIQCELCKHACDKVFEKEKLQGLIDINKPEQSVLCGFKDSKPLVFVSFVLSVFVVFVAVSYLLDGDSLEYCNLENIKLYR